MDYGCAHNNHSKAESGVASKQKHVKFKIRHSPTESQDSPDTSSTSLSDSSSDDYIQVNPKILPKFRAHNNNNSTLSNGPQKSLFYENDDIDLPSEALYRLEESINGGSSGSTSRFSNITHESLMPQLSPTQSPPMQVMDKTGGFDPTRIPHSAFSKSSTPTEWSVASNDSLFSIRIGDGSFSRDRISSEVLKPEELSEKRLGEGELIMFGPTPSPNFKGIEPYFDIEETIIAKPEEIQAVEERIGDGPTKGHVDTVKSEIRAQHFVKAVKKKSSCFPCHCGDCCRSLFCGDCCRSLFCVCKRLSCLCKCPSCSFKWCVWPGCFGICSSCRCKCPEFPTCCCKCPNWWSCCCKFPNWSSCCCKCSSWSCCKCSSWSCFKCSSSSCCKCSSWSCFKCSSWSCFNCSSCSCFKCSFWSCFKCSSWSCCKCSSWPCCKCSSWSCFKCSSWSCFKCSSCSCFKCSSWSCFKCSFWSCFKCSFWSCFKCSSCSCCKCQCSSCTWACCYCWNRERKTSSYDSPTTLTDGGTTNSKSSTNASSSERKSSCFSCSYSCSCCACWSCSCCC